MEVNYFRNELSRITELRKGMATHIVKLRISDDFSSVCLRLLLEIASRRVENYDPV